VHAPKHEEDDDDACVVILFATGDYKTNLKFKKKKKT
jgi:hypothetical protein